MTQSKLIVFSGAGLSAESGIQTFRDINGLWCGFNPDEVCNFYNWRQNFSKVHDFYDGRRTELGTVAPNAAHTVLANLQKEYGIARVELWTQNVDDLLERAGALKVHHVHGFIREVRCCKCNHIQDIGYTKAPRYSCPVCGDNVHTKPNVIFFNETAPMYGFLYPVMRKAIKDRENTVLVIGTSGNVVPLEGLGIRKRSVWEAFKIFNALSRDMNDLSVFDACYLKPVTEAMSGGLEQMLRDRLEGKLNRSSYFTSKIMK